ncbi:MAG: hypothetical protein WC451_00785 [Patescibacteria group bacterium]|jgi:hypothetical protein
MSSDNPLEEAMSATWPMVLLVAGLLFGGIACAVWALYLFAVAGEAVGLPILGISTILLLIFGGIVRQRQAAKKTAASRFTAGYS